MASKRIQGITIEIGGDTSKLQTALKGVDTELRKTQGNLKDINKLLKLDPGNTELLVQKQKNLQESIKATEERLKTLKATQTDSLSPEEYDNLQREIIDTEQHLDGLEDEYKSFGSVAQQKIAAVGQAMQEAGGKIADFGRQMQEVGNVVPNKLKQIGSAINEHVLQPMMQVAKVVGAAGIGVTTALTKGAVDAAAEYEQLAGGIETLFGKSSAKVIKNANRAFKTSGQSVNDYMKTVTSFSASLLRSLGGNTDKAARLADMAIQDMSDNANKFGMDFASIEAAYRGFAKEQYTLLDNLSLGYAGTKAGMEQLIRDAEKLDTTFKVTHNTVKKGKTVNDELAYSYDDIIKAIHIIQDNMGVTGTTAAEASKTIEGSFNSMKAAWSNLLTAIGTGEDVKTATKNALSTASTYLKENLLPTIKTSLSSITTVADEVWAWLEPQLPAIKTKLVNWLNKKIPEIPGDIAEALTNAFYVIRIAISGAFAVISAQLSKWITGDYSLAGKFRNSFLNARQDIEDALSKIGGALSRLWKETLADYFKGKLKTFITTTLPKLTDTLEDIADKISGLIDWFNGLDPEIKNTILDVGLAIIAGSLAISGMGKVITKGGELVKSLGGIVTAITGSDGILAAGRSMITMLSNPWVGIPFALVTLGVLAATHWEDIKRLWNDGKQFIFDAVDWLKVNVPQAWKAFWNALPEPVRKVVNAIKSMVQGMINKITTALNKFDDLVRKTSVTKDTDPSKARTEWKGGYRNDYGEAVNIPSFFAKGGTLNEGQSAVVGEVAPEYLRVVNGRAVVTPLTNQPGRLGGDTNVNITINAQPGQSAEQIAAAVKRVFIREMEQRSAAYA